MNNQPTPVAVQQTTVIQVGSQKSVAGAVLLALFFGPLGMIYATVTGALIMFLISFVVAIATLGLGLLITTPICAIWAGVAASNHNKRLGVASQHAALTGQAAPAGWHPDPDGSGRLRYYDGIQWTSHYAQQTAGAGATAVPESTQPTPQLETAAAAPPTLRESPAETEEAEPGEDDADESEAPTTVAAVGAASEPVPQADPERVFCGACGESITATARFCPACGETQALA
jgi:hypothetical protein